MLQLSQIDRSIPIQRSSAGYTVRVSVLRVHFQFTKEFDGVWLQERERKREREEGIKRR